MISDRSGCLRSSDDKWIAEQVHELEVDVRVRGLLGQIQQWPSECCKKKQFHLHTGWVSVFLFTLAIRPCRQPRATSGPTLLCTFAGTAPQPSPRRSSTCPSRPCSAATSWESSRTRTGGRNYGSCSPTPASISSKPFNLVFTLILNLISMIEISEIEKYWWRAVT